ncbi:MAG: fibronectin type III domain-containing protein [Candidatus Magasanikbacteria bacterium]|nr:fibronectin type III domain-containing protein [Candidatus Magasanikbacteria bacterium]
MLLEKNRILQKISPIFTGYILVFSLIIFIFIANTTQAAVVLEDTFTGTTINTSKWNEVDATGVGGSSGSIQQNDALTIVGDGANWGGVRLVSQDSFLRSSTPMLQTDFSVSVTGQFGAPIAYGPNDILNHATNENYALIVHNSGSFYIARRYNNAWATLTSTGVAIVANRRYRAIINIGTSAGATFELYQDTNGDGDFNDVGEDIDLFAGGVNSIADGTFSTGYFITASHSSSLTTTIYSSIVSDSSVPTTVPDAPTSLTATSSSTEMVLSWTAPVNNGGVSITDYKVEYKLASEPTTWSTFADGTSTTTTTTVTGLTNGLSYDFRVSATNTNGTSNASSISSATPISSTPTVPTANTITITGLVSVGELITGNYTFNDVNGDSEATSLYRWLKADTADGTYSAISGETSINYTVASSDLNKYFKFEVTPIADTTPITGNAYLSSATSQVNELSYFNHILSTGQSLSEGQNGSPALSTSQPYSNKMLSGSSLVPLIESSVETMSSAMANTLTALSPDGSFQSAVTRHGIGGTAYSGLKKGTSAYNNGLSQTTDVKNAATALGLTDRVIGVTAIHGESDQLAGNGGLYQGYLEAWQSDYETDIKAITGQTRTIPLFTDQMSSFNWYNAAFPSITLDQLSAAEDNPDKIVLVTPKYFFTYSDSAHLTNVGYRWLGEYYGKVIKKVVIDGEAWRPLSPDTIVRNDNVIYAQFHVPAGELAFDTSLVSARNNYGFEYYDSTTSASISSVELLDSETVKVTLDSTPTGSGQKLRYAYTGVAGTVPGAQIVGSPAGNLRDTDPTSSLYGNTLYNWAVHFDKVITEDFTLPINSSITSIPTSITTAIAWATNEAGSSIVDYGLTSSYTTSTIETNTPTRVTDHSISLSNLLPCTRYHYRVRSKDLAQNQGTSSDNTFTTLGCTGSAAVEEIKFSTVTVSTGATINFNSGTANLSLNVPANFSSTLNYSVEFQLNKLNTNAVILTTNTPSETSIVGEHTYNLTAFEDVNTAIQNFDKNIVITITYIDSDVSELDETTLAIYYWTGSAWSVLDNCSVNTTANTVSCETNHFTTFGVFGSAASSVSGGGGYVLPHSIGNGTTDTSIGMGQTKSGFIINTKGKNFLAYINSMIGFVAYRNNKKYIVKIEELDMSDRRIKLVLNPDPVAIYLYPKQTKNIDLNKDGINDIKIKYNELLKNRIDLTFTKLENKKIKEQVEKQENTSTSKKQSYKFTRSLRVGMSGRDVKELQKYLNNNRFTLSSKGESGSSGYETEFFGRATKNALIKFQNKYYNEILKPVKLSVGTGYFGPSTIKFVNDSNNKIIEKTEQSIKKQVEVKKEIKTSSLFTKGLEIGMKNNDVRRLQKLLSTLPSIYLERLTTGYFGILTEKAVQRFQLKYGVIKDSTDIGFGYVGPSTRSKLNEVFGE